MRLSSSRGLQMTDISIWTLVISTLMLILVALNAREENRSPSARIPWAAFGNYDRGLHRTRRLSCRSSFTYCHEPR